MLAGLPVSFSEEKAAGVVCPEQWKGGNHREVHYRPSGCDCQASATFLEAQPVLHSARLEPYRHRFIEPEIGQLVAVLVHRERHAQMFLPVHESVGHLQVKDRVGLSVPVEFEVQIDPFESAVEDDLLSALRAGESAFDDKGL